MPPRTYAALPLLGQEKGGRAAAYPDVITVASHTKKGNPARLPSRPSSPQAAPGSPYVLTRSAGGHRPGAGDGTVRHLYSSGAQLANDRRERGIDLLSPVWQLLELTPHGRGDWYPSLSYQ